MYPFKYVLTEPPKKSSNTKSSDTKEKEKTKWDEFNEVIRDMKTSWLAKLGELNQRISADKCYNLFIGICDIYMVQLLHFVPCQFVNS
jgi:hypothetical protein